MPRGLFHRGKKVKFKIGDKVMLKETANSLVRDDERAGRGPFTIRALASIRTEEQVWYSMYEQTPYRYKEQDLELINKCKCKLKEKRDAKKI